MSKKKKEARKLQDARSVEAQTAILHCKGGPMRHRCDRRTKERENAWRKEVD